MVGDVELLGRPLGYRKGFIKVSIVTNGPNNYYQASSIEPIIKRLNISAIVSPGNSYGHMEGGFDLAISKYYCSLFPASAGVNPRRVTKAVQASMFDKGTRMLGYNPPQSAVFIPGEKLMAKIASSHTNSNSHGSGHGHGYGHGHGGQYNQYNPPPTYHRNNTAPDLIHVPTMAVPQKIHYEYWTRLSDSVIFNSMWHMLATVADAYLFTNVQPTGYESEEYINILVTGMGTGVGNVPEALAAEHMYKAMETYSILLCNQSPESEDVQTCVQIVKENIK